MQSALATSSGYDYRNDPNTGNPIAINRATGEITNAHTVIVPDGTRILTPEDQERRQKFFDLKAEREMIEKANQSKPCFVFVKNSSPFDQLPPATVVRLIVLGTYASYDGRLLLNCRTPMRRAHLQKVLNMSAGNVASFLKSVMPQYIIEENGYLRVSDDPVFMRGRIKGGQHDSWTRFFIESTRAVYRSATQGSRKHLGYVFQLLPYISHEHNILCMNPTEKHIENVQPLTLGEFCDLISYDKKNVDRLLRAYKKIRFVVNGNAESFCWFVNDGLNISDSRIIINPLVLYSGKNPDGVRNLGVLCASTQKSIHKN